MNTDNVLLAIEVMGRVVRQQYEFDIGTWVGTDSDYSFPTTEQEASECGTAACFAGWIALSPEGREAGMHLSKGGTPGHGNDYGVFSVVSFLDIPFVEAKHLAHGNKAVYGVPRSEITAQHVLDVLYRLRDTGSVYP